MTLKKLCCFLTGISVWTISRGTRWIINLLSVIVSTVNFRDSAGNRLTKKASMAKLAFTDCRTVNEQLTVFVFKLVYCKIYHETVTKEWKLNILRPSLKQKYCSYFQQLLMTLVGNKWCKLACTEKLQELSVETSCVQKHIPLPKSELHFQQLFMTHRCRILSNRGLMLRVKRSLVTNFYELFFVVLSKLGQMRFRYTVITTTT